MVNNEQARRERAHKIWEIEGRPEGRHLDHWERVDEDGDAIEKEAEDVTEANQEARREINRDGKQPSPAADIGPPSATSPD